MLWPDPGMLKFLYRAIKSRYRDQRLETRIMLAALRPGAVAADVGAYKGAYLFWMARAVRPGGRIIAVEPQPRLEQYLRSMCARLRWDHVEIAGAALSDHVGTATLHVPGGGVSPGAALHPHGPGEVGASVTCRLQTLDQLFDGKGEVAFIKLDVEGHELQVLRGGRETLTRHAPVILMECEARHLRTHTMHDVFALLTDLGYGGEFFSPHGLLPLSAFDPAVHQRQDGTRFWDAPDYCNNFLFRRP